MLRAVLLTLVLLAAPAAAIEPSVSRGAGCTGEPESGVEKTWVEDDVHMTWTYEEHVACDRTGATATVDHEGDELARVVLLRDESAVDESYRSDADGVSCRRNDDDWPGPCERGDGEGAATFATSRRTHMLEAEAAGVPVQAATNSCSQERHGALTEEWHEEQGAGVATWEGTSTSTSSCRGGVQAAGEGVFLGDCTSQTQTTEQGTYTYDSGYATWTYDVTWTEASHEECSSHVDAGGQSVEFERCSESSTTQQRVWGNETDNYGRSSSASTDRSCTRGLDESREVDGRTLRVTAQVSD